MRHMQYIIAAFGRLAAATLVLCLFAALGASPAPAGETANTSGLISFAASAPAVAAMGDDGELAHDRKDNTDDSVAEQIFGGGYLGALFFGYPATGFGGADLVVLAILAYLLLRSAGRRKPDGKDRFTVHRGGLDKDTEVRPPSDLSGGRPRDRSNPRSGANSRNHAWSRKMRGGADGAFDSNGGAGDNGADSAGDNGKSGKNPWSRQNNGDSTGQPHKTMRDVAETMWGHLASGQQEQEPESPAAAVAEGARVPAAFDVKDFLDGARALYVRLQQAWASRNVDDIAPFVSEAILTMLRGQAKVSPEPSPVEILLVNATLQNVRGDSDDQQAIVYFNALMRAAGADQPAEVTEIWTFARSGDSGGNWQLISIEAA